MEDTDNAAHAKDLPLKNSKDHQLPQPLSEDSIGYQSPPPLVEPLEVAQPAEEIEALPALYFICFGRFEVKRLGQSLSLCSNRNGQAILRYLVAQSGHRVTIDTLMALLWPDDEPEVAHHKLQVAISALRRSLNNGYTSDPGGGYILCKNGVYQLNPSVSLRSDIDEFLAFYQVGRQYGGSAAIVQYEAACRLYTGPFLPEDLYADWPLIQREQLRQAHLVMCVALAEHYLEVGHYEDVAKWASAMLKENRCDEVAHRLLIRVYAAEGRRSEALRQYQHCERVVAEELGMPLMPETVNLFHATLSGQILPNDRTKIEPE
jgi:DNA-binding SARP family transcriptional activator